MKTPYMKRFVFLGVGLGIFGVLVIFQMIRLQFISIPADPLIGYWKHIIPERGSIYDRWGHLLAGNQKVYEVGVDLQSVHDAKAIALTVSNVLNVDYGDALAAASQKFVKKEKVYNTLADFVTQAQIDQLQALVNQYSGTSRRSNNGSDLSGLIWTEHLGRSYPEGSLASNIIGFSSKEDQNTKGYYGIEEKYNDLLAGTPRDVWVPYGPKQAEQITEVPPGASLVLTIDRALQASTEASLDSALKRTGSSGGTIVVMDPRNGEILAMATDKRMDLNKYWEFGNIYTNDLAFDRATETIYEPGSVFKVLTMAAALDSGAVTPDTTFIDHGVIEIGGTYIYNWNRGAWGKQDMVGCLQHSLNVCLTWVATQLGPNRFYDYLRAFGIGHPTGIDLAGETTYPLRLPGDGQWYEVDLGTNSFGQGVSITAIQMEMAVSSVANGQGKMMAPHLVKSMVINGRQYDTNPQVVGMPIKAETAQTLTKMLSTSLKQESSVALVDGYTVAGKTGTAEIPTPYGTYSSTEWNASFVGWGPVDDPRFLIWVWLEKPKADVWGSTMAAPVFSEVFKNMAVLTHLPPDEIRQKLNNQ